jgi:hypothetical protein
MAKVVRTCHLQSFMLELLIKWLTMDWTIGVCLQQWQNFSVHNRIEAPVVAVERVEFLFRFREFPGSSLGPETCLP